MHTVTARDAEKIYGWLQTRGGIAVWPSIDFSCLEMSWTTPAKTTDGKNTPKPTWRAGNVPNIITDPAEVTVSFDKEVKRFRVGVRMGSQGLTLKVTDKGTRRIRSEVAKAGHGAYYVFDYDMQEAVIFAPEKTISLLEFMRATV